MKKLVLVIGISLSLCCLSSNSLYAQADEEAKPFIVQTNYLQITEANRDLNLDSLLKIYKERLMDANPYFTSSKIVLHWWGHDSRQLIIIHELKSWDDIEKAFDKRNELMRTMIKDGDENTKKFMKVMRAVFEGSHHSDEIYRVVGE